MKKIYYILIFILFTFLKIDNILAADIVSVIDYPLSTPNYSDEIIVRGWVMCGEEINNIKVYVDGNNLNYDYERFQRADVNEAVTGFNNNPSPGYSGKINISAFENGTHDLKVEYLNGDKVLGINEKKFKVKRDGLIHLERPTGIISGTTINVQGWKVKSGFESEYKFYIDGNQIDLNINEYERADVNNAVTFAGDRIINSNAGFKGELDVHNYKDGKHTIKAELIKAGKVISADSIIFNLDKYRIASVIDYPLSTPNYSDEIIVRGWVMCGEEINNIKVYVDGNNLNYDYERFQRADVNEAVTGFNNNPSPGYSGKINISAFENGTHDLKVEYLNGDKVLGINEKKFKVKRDGLIHLERPTGIISGTTINVQGWKVKSGFESEYKFYIDGNQIDLNINEYERADVNNAVTFAGDRIINSNAGFKGELDVHNYKDGKHTIKAELIKAGKVISADSIIFNLDKYRIASVIDYPLSTPNYSDEIIVRGWVMCGEEINNIKVYVDGNNLNYDYERFQRADVNEAVTGFNNNPSPGYSGKINISAFENGTHDLKVEYLNGDKVLGINEKKFKVKRDGLIHLERPTGIISGTTINVQGWKVKSGFESEYKFYIDGNQIDLNINEYERADVNNAVTFAGDRIINSNAGFKGELDVHNYKDGKHTIKAELIKAGEVISTDNITFNLEKYSTSGDFDNIGNNYNQIGINLEASGYYKSNCSNTSVVVYVNDDLIDTYNVRYENDRWLFNSKIDFSTYKDGKNNIKLDVINNDLNEVIFSKTKVINLTKYDSILYVDYPVKNTFSSTSNLTVSGWEISECNSTVKVFVDNKEYNVDRYRRQDVLDAFPGLYGGEAVNATSGYKSVISLTNFSEGKHHIKINLYNSMNELIKTTQKSIYVYTNTYFGIDVSAHQGKINWEQVSSTGIDFVIIRLGYGSNFTSQDDTEFINNVNGATKYGIPYGVYLYSYATKIHGPSGINPNDPNFDNSDSEAAHALRILNSLSSEQKRHLKLPVFIDMEDSQTIFVGKPVLTDIANNFCNIVSNNGYNCGVYANKNWLNNYLDNNYLASKYDIWLAHYIDNTDYTGIYQIWQYSSTGSLKGINSHFVDMNISYKKFW